MAYLLAMLSTEQEQWRKFRWVAACIPPTRLAHSRLLLGWGSAYVSWHRLTLGPLRPGAYRIRDHVAPSLEILPVSLRFHSRMGSEITKLAAYQRHCLTLRRINLKMFELWCLCCIMMFRRVNIQPGMQTSWNWCSYYQEIYDWISPPNKRSGWTFYSNTVYGGKWAWWIWSLVNFQSFEALNDAFEVQFCRA